MDYRHALWFLAFLCVSFSVLFLAIPKPEIPAAIEPINCGALVKVYTNETPGPLSIRVLIFRHADQQMAIDDANLVIRGVEKAKEKGLDIKVIGNHLVRNKDELQSILESKVTTDAIAGDTLIVHTIGHGFSGGGGLDRLGKRADVMDILVKTAQKHQQEMIWWQLSCYAAANLPDIHSLSPNDQNLFSNIASSNASQTSAAGIQGKIMERVFMAMAERSKAIDPDGDDIITAKELKDFLNSLDGSRRGDLLFAQAQDEPIFGVFGPGSIPIIDRNRPQRQYERNFIPIPCWR